MWHCHRGDRTRLSHGSTCDCQADRSGQSQDPGRRIPYEVPSDAELPERLDTVLQVVYLVFTEGYAASSGESLTRPDLSGEAIRLGRLLVDLLPEAEVQGLLELMVLHESRRGARASPDDDLILLDDQDRSLWDHALIYEGAALVERALASRRFGAYTLLAAIAAVHAEASAAVERTGSRLLASMTRCCSQTRRRSWNSTGRWQSLCATVQRQASP